MFLNTCSMLVVFLQEFAWNYSKLNALRTRRIIKHIVIDVIEKGQRSAIQWNVQVVMQTT